MDLRERVARAICRARGHDPAAAYGFSRQFWVAFLPEADAAVAEAFAGQSEAFVSIVGDRVEAPIDARDAAAAFAALGYERREDSHGAFWVRSGASAPPAAPQPPTPAPTPPRTDNAPSTAGGEGEAFLAACEKSGVIVATEADGSRWVSVDELWRLERAGFVVAPREPTEAMLKAGDDCASTLAITHDSDAGLVWERMIDAATREGR